VEIETAEEEEVGMGGEALDSRCRMLERLASEVSRLGYYATKGKVSAVLWLGCVPPDHLGSQQCMQGQCACPRSSPAPAV